MNDFVPPAERLEAWLKRVPLETAAVRAAELLNEYVGGDFKPMDRRAQCGQSADRVEGTALHEAGHAVIALRLHVPVSRVEIRRDAGSSSRAARIGGQVLHERSDDYFINCLISLAGAATELVMGADAYRRYELSRSHDVVSTVRQLLEARATYAIPSIAIACVTAISANLSTIARVGDALLERGELDSAAVEALCGSTH